MSRVRIRPIHAPIVGVIVAFARTAQSLMEQQSMGSAAVWGVGLGVASGAVVWLLARVEQRRHAR